MGASRWQGATLASWVVLLGVVATLLNVASGLKITELRVPDVIQNGTKESVILDCVYTFEKESSEGLVIKWFFNQNPTPVYQWISGKNPQGLGVLKNKLNLAYRASQEEHKAHRALKIMNPTTELSGEYKCVVSTFASEVSQAKTMVVYVPEKSLELTQTRQEHDSDERVNITCSAEGVFPEPRMTITKVGGSKLPEMRVLTVPHDGVYDIHASVLVDDDDSDEEDNSDEVNDNSNSDGDVDVDEGGPTTFECELEIPEANYSVKKETVFYPGPPTTTVEPDSDSDSNSDSDSDSDSDESDGDANSSGRPAIAWSLLLMPIVLFLRL